MEWKAARPNEWTCSCGVGHYGRNATIPHGCCENGCCQRDDFPGQEKFTYHLRMVLPEDKQKQMREKVIVSEKVVKTCKTVKTEVDKFKLVIKIWPCDQDNTATVSLTQDGELLKVWMTTDKEMYNRYFVYYGDRGTYIFYIDKE
jgi:hypothetical protein